jgi:hypothetical protein
VYVDDLLIESRDLREVIWTLENTRKFKLKGVGSLTYHLGCDYFWDKDGTLRNGPRKYIGNIMDQYENMFGSKPKEFMSLLQKGNHPEIDVTEDLDEGGIKKLTQ